MVDCEWVYRMKQGISGVMPKTLKVMVAAKGFTQREGIDFTNVFSLVVRHASIRIILSLMPVNDMHLE